MTSPTPEAACLVEITGDPYDRGVQYGAAVPDRIEKSAAYYRQLFERDHGLDWETVTRRAGSWIEPLKAFDPELFQELEGIADGARRPVEELLALNGRGEMIYGAGPPDGCTTFAVLPNAASDGHVYGGQNWDWRASTRDTWIVLRVIQPPRPTVITVVEAGQVGRYGANSAGIGLFAAGLAGFGTTVTGIPQPFIRRAILNSQTFKRAIDTVLTARQQISASLLLVHRDGAAIAFESTPTERAWLYPRDGILAHANHYEALAGPSYMPYGGDSLYRVQRVRTLLGRNQGTSSPASPVGTITAALTDHVGFPDSVCAHPDPAADDLDQWETLTSTVIDLTTGDWWLAPGPPCVHRLVRLPWNLYDDQRHGRSRS